MMLPVFHNRKFKALLRTGENRFITIGLIKGVFGLDDEDEVLPCGGLRIKGSMKKMILKVAGALLCGENIISISRRRVLYREETSVKTLDRLKDTVESINSSNDYTYDVTRVRVTSEYPIMSGSYGIRPYIPLWWRLCDGDASEGAQTD